MKVKVESLGLPTLSQLIGKKIDIDLPDDASIRDLLDLIRNRFGPKVEEVLFDSSGNLDLTIQIMLNEDTFVPLDKIEEYKLKDGDKVSFLLLAGGG